jgi:hypothetical protein
MSLGYVVAKPYGQMHRYDFMVEGGNKLWRIQVKTSTCMRDGRYQLCVQRITHRRCVAYKKSELDFVVAYLMPIKTWYILPISLVAGRRSFLLATEWVLVRVARHEKYFQAGIRADCYPNQFARPESRCHHVTEQNMDWTGMLCAQPKRRIAILSHQDLIPTFPQSLPEHFTNCPFVLDYENRIHRLPFEPHVAARGRQN